MTDNELKKIAGKIAKCLALANSDNEGEAEAAKRQATALMVKYSLSMGDVGAAQVHEKHSPTGGNYRPPLYLNKLAGMIAKAFGCEAIAFEGRGFVPSLIKFLGLGVKPELAAYTYDVLRRQLVKDRTAYLATLKRYHKTNKTKMADIFCHGWLFKIHSQVQEFAGTELEKSAIAAYKQQNFTNLKEDSRKNPQTGAKQAGAIVAGMAAAQDVSIHKPVQGKRRSGIEHQA